MRRLIHDRAPDMRCAPRGRGRHDALRRDGARWLADGTTSLAELIRVTREVSTRHTAADARFRSRRSMRAARRARPDRRRDAAARARPLRGLGLFPTAIEAPNSADAGTGGTIDRTRLPPALLALTTRFLTTLTRSGMPVDQALSAVAEQADDTNAAKLFTALRGQVAAGKTLAAALARWPRTFPICRVCDRRRGPGRLPRSSPASPTISRRQALKEKFTLALIYPALVTAIALAVIAVCSSMSCRRSCLSTASRNAPLAHAGADRHSDFFRATAWLWLAAAAAGDRRFARWPTGA